MEHVCWIGDSDMEEEEPDEEEEGNRPNDCLFSFLTKSSSFVLLLVTATSVVMAACLSPTLSRQPIHRRCCWTPKLPSSSTATYCRRPHRRITGSGSAAVSARASAAAVAQGLDADDIRHPLDKQVSS
jgi:hypothetical protein